MIHFFQGMMLVGMFFFMEFVAWFTHKFVMHGFLWSLHRDHHKRESRSFFQRNDFFFLFFSIPGILLIFLGVGNISNGFLFWAGMGITVYGMTYFLVHDIFIHQRFNWFRKSRNSYLLALKRGHRVHHSNINKENGECFGMLWVPIKFFRENTKERKKASS